MASTQSSAQFSRAISQHIDRVINTQVDGPDFDLDNLIAEIDSVLALHKANQGKSSKPKKLTVDWLPSTSDAATISEGISENVKNIATQISEYSGDKHSTAIAVLNAAGNIHWVGVGLLVVAAVIQRVDTIKNNKNECLDLLNSMNDLAKVVRTLKEIPCAKDKMETQINESIACIVEGAILCCSQKKKRKVKSFISAPKDRDELIALRLRVDEKYKSLTLQIGVQGLSVGVQSLSILENSLTCNQPPIPSVKHAVGIEQQIVEVVKRLQWENDTPSVAVVVHGFGGSGKTTLADAVYDSLRDKLKGWKYSKITLIQNLEYPKVEQLKSLQSLILQDLTGRNEEVRDLESGRQRLKEIMEKESTFLYIDNVMLRNHLEELLPREIINPKKLRLLLTARISTMSDVMKKCGIKCEIYPIEPLPLGAAIKVLCKEEKTNFVLKNRHKIEVIAQRCSSCPLSLELVGGYLRRRNDVEACDRVLKWMENGEPFSGHRDERVDDERILFAYEQLEPSFQEAFLDICCFFYNWEWEEVACIIGKEEMECLEEGALIKRKILKSYDSVSVTEICIHDLLLHLGRKKSKGTRFRTVEEFNKALQDHSQFLPQTKGLWLTQTEKDRPRPIEVSAEVLDTMSGSLRVFAMGNWTNVEGKCNKSFHKLIFLQAGEVPILPMDIAELPCLTYMNCLSFKGAIKLNQLKLQNLSSLKVFKVSNPAVCQNFEEISEFGLPKELKQLVLQKFGGTVIPSSDLDHLKKLDLSQSHSLENLSEWLGKLTSLQELRLYGCKKLQQLPEGIGKLKALVYLNLSDCKSLKELPSNFGKLTSLKNLNLKGCSMLLKLPMDFVKLSSLEHLDLSDCKSLEELPSNFEKLTSLQNLILKGCSGLLKLEWLGSLPSLRKIDFRRCDKVSTLPQNLGRVTSLLTSDEPFDGCGSLRELPEETCWLSGMKKISFYGCSSLERIPTQFSNLTGLEQLAMGRCKSLSTLPPGFGKLRSLQILDLFECGKLKKLCDDFHYLGALRDLNLFACESLEELPSNFDKLTSLQNLNLEGCSGLLKLPERLGNLPSLRRIHFQRCENLSTLPQSLGRVNSLLMSESPFYGCKSLRELPEETSWFSGMKKISFNGCSSLERIPTQFSKLTGLEQLNMGGCKSLSTLPQGFGKLRSLQILDLSKCGKLEEFCGDFHWLGALRDLNLSGCCSLTKLPDCFGQLACLESLNLSGCCSLAKLPDCFGQLACLETLNLSGCCSLAKLPDCFSQFGCLKSLNLSGCSNLEKLCERLGWEWMESVGAIQSLWNFSASERMVQRWGEIKRQNEMQREMGRKAEILIKFLGAHHTEYLLHNNKQVKVSDLKGKVVLLLQTCFSVRSIQISALEDVYLKLQKSSEYRAEVVWIPFPEWFYSNPEDYERDATSAPWPAVPHPWLINPDLKHCFKDGRDLVVVVVDEKGNVSCVDAMPMILRWGIEAYPFSANREKELRKAEWGGLKINSQSSLEFVFQNLELFQSKAREAMLRGEMIFVCVGSIHNMLKFLPKLNCALKKLGSVVQVFYVGEVVKYYPVRIVRSHKEEEKEYEMKRNEMCSITSLSLCDVYKFRERVQCLWEELVWQGVDEKTVQVRSMVLAFVSALTFVMAHGRIWDSHIKKLMGLSHNYEEYEEEEEEEEEDGEGIRIVGVDEKGEMISGRGEEVVQLLCRSDTEEHQKLLDDITSEGFSNFLRRRWALVTVHPKHHPHHPLVGHNEELLLQRKAPERCDTCSHRLWGIGYRCSVCPKYEMCLKCFMS